MIAEAIVQDAQGWFQQGQALNQAAAVETASSCVMVLLGIAGLIMVVRVLRAPRHDNDCGDKLPSHFTDLAVRQVLQPKE